MKLITLTVLAVMTAFGGLAQPPNSSPPKAAPPADAGLPVALGSVYHDFMERFADENPAWKTEISLAADITRPPSPPYRINYSDTLGYYSYRVKRWDELSAYEKFAVQHDPRLPHFIREVYGKDLPGATGEETSDATAQATGGGQQAAVAPREEPPPRRFLPTRESTCSSKPRESSHKRKACSSTGSTGRPPYHEAAQVAGGCPGQIIHGRIHLSTEGSAHQRSQA